MSAPQPTPTASRSAKSATLSVCMTAPLSPGAEYPVPGDAGTEASAVGGS